MKKQLFLSLFAICALAGVFVGKFFDVWTLSKTHSLTLKKEYFLKKLNAFEKASTYYTITHTSLTFIANVFNLLNNDQVEFPKETIDLMLKKSTENLERVQQSTQDSALAIGLYTDFPFASDEEVLYTRYLEVLGQIQLKTQILSLLNQENDEKNDGLTDKIINEMLDLISEIVGISSQLKNLYTRLTAQLRAEVRKFDGDLK